MIQIILNRPEYEYDVYGLTTSFFPGEEVSVKKTTASEDEFIIDIEDTCVSFDIHACGVVGKKIYELGKTNCDAKSEAGIYLYEFLSEVTGKILPWGNLTGIRPTKIIRNMLSEKAEATGKSYKDSSIIEEVRKELYDTRRLKGDKFDLGVDIATRELDILSSLHKEDGYSVYIGIPFCPSTCLYCSFTSNPVFKYRKKMDEYLEALIKEIKWTAENMKDYHLDSVYIGGGTPTTLEPLELDKLLGAIIQYLPIDNIAEFTVEAGRADSITREKLEVLKKYPVTRISVNPQTMKDETLKFIGRNHTVEQVRQAYALAREAGFDNINMDIILGLPGEKLTDVENTVTEIAKMNPESLTVHSLAIKRASKLKLWMQKNNIDNDIDFEKAMDICIKAAESTNLKPYYLYRQKQMAGNLENIGFSKEGKYGIYNILIMEEVQSIVALGAGSVSKRVFADGRIERCDNVKDIDLYLERIDEMIERKNQLFNL